MEQSDMSEIERVVAKALSFELQGTEEAWEDPHYLNAARAAISAIKATGPVAWLYEAHMPVEGPTRFVQANRANMDKRYWTETPLYRL